jgi:RNA polymerase-binding protein DksA
MSAARKPTRRSSRSRSRANKTAAKKTAAKKTAAKKTTPKKSTTRKATTAKKTSARKPAARKPTAKKTAARKPTAKKTSARKPVKKTPARARRSKKTPAKKTAKKTVKKTPAKTTRSTASKTTRQTTKKTVTRAPAKTTMKKGTGKRPSATASSLVAPKPKVRPVRAAKFDAAQLEAIRGRLTEELESLQRRETELEEASFEDTQSGMTGEVGLDDDFADAGTATFERERDLSIRNNIRDLIDQMTRAIRRIDEGTYGTCERCGRPIDAARLKALPHALLCMDCKRREERAR